MHMCRTVYFLKEIKGVGGVSMIQAMIGGSLWCGIIVTL